jgi:4'-phosphopantetheinyl transferase
VLPAGVCTAGELERAAAILDPVRRHAFVAGRLALRALVAEAVGEDPRRVAPAYRCPECGAGEHGVPGFVLHPAGSVQPGLPGGGGADDAACALPLPVAASMSRAGGWALLAVHPAEVTPCAPEVTPCAREVGPRVHPRRGLGVDLALVAEFRDAIPDAVFSEAERRRVSDSGDPAAEAARLWARKEAMLKALGTGLRGDPAALDAAGDERVRDLDATGLGLPGGFAAALAFA